VRWAGPLARVRQQAGSHRLAGELFGGWPAGAGSPMRSAPTLW